MRNVLPKNHGPLASTSSPALEELEFEIYWREWIRRATRFVGPLEVIHPFEIFESVQPLTAVAGDVRMLTANVTWSCLQTLGSSQRYVCYPAT